MKKFIILILYSGIIQASSCISFERSVAINITQEEPNISIIAPLLDTGTTYQILITKTMQPDSTIGDFLFTVQNSSNKVVVENAKVYVTDPANKIYPFTYTVIADPYKLGRYICQKFPITNGRYKLTVEWNGNTYESYCTPMPDVVIQKFDATPINTNPTGGINYLLSCTFSTDKDIDNYYFVVFNTINSKYGIYDIFSFSDDDKLKNYNGLPYTFALATTSFDNREGIYQLFTGDVLKIRIVSFHSIQGAMMKTYRTNPMNSNFVYPRTNIKNITDPTKPPYGFFVINKYADKSILIKN